MLMFCMRVAFWAVLLPYNSRYVTEAIDFTGGDTQIKYLQSILQKAPLPAAPDIAIPLGNGKQESLKGFSC